MKRTALALSPHLDDAVFSCGGTLASLARLGWRVVVATLFTRSVPDPRGFALACQLDKGLGPEVDYMALRRAEDARALAALGADPPIHLPFAEAPHRGYASAKVLFAPPLASDDVVAPLGRALRDLIEAETPDLLLAPQGIGGHVDHVQAATALRDRGRGGPPVLWWRDFPYVVREGDPADPFRTALAGLPDRTIALDPSDVAAREAACLAYASQIGFQFGGTVGLQEKLAAAGSEERFKVDGTVTTLLTRAGP